MTQAGCSAELKQSTTICSSDLAPELRQVACPLDSRCGYAKHFEVTTSWNRIFSDWARTGLEEGEQCSYKLSVEESGEGDAIEIEVATIENTVVMAYSGEESLRSGDGTAIGSAGAGSKHTFAAS